MLEITYILAIKPVLVTEKGSIGNDFSFYIENVVWTLMAHLCQFLWHSYETFNMIRSMNWKPYNFIKTSIMSYLYDKVTMRVYWEETNCIYSSTSIISNIWFSFVGEMKISQKIEQH